MAVPTVTRLTPTTGRTLGHYLVHVYGTGFRLPTVPSSSGPAPAAPPSVRVRFTSGATSRTALRVDVVSSTHLEVLMPAADSGAHAIVVENVDDNGAVIAGEAVTVAAAFTFARPDLSTNRERKLPRLVRALLQELKRHLLTKEVHLVTHSDFDSDTVDALNTIEFAALPSIVVVGPRLRRTDGVYIDNSVRTAQDPNNPGTTTYERFGSLQRDVYFDIVGAAETAMQALNLMQEVERLPATLLTLTVDGEAHELAVVPSSEMSGLGAANPDNIRQFTTTWVVRAVYLDNEDGDLVRGVTELEDFEVIGSVQASTPFAIGTSSSGTIGQGTVSNPVADPRQPIPDGLTFEQLEE